MTRRHQTIDSARGFSYIDVMIAMTILLIGIMALGAALTAGLVQTSSGESRIKAKALAATQLENVMSARYIKLGGNAYSFDAIRNVSTPPGVFLATKHDIHELPGPDGLFGTADDNGDVIPGFQRKIEITDVNNPIRPSPPNPITERQIKVTIYYKEKDIERTETLTTNIDNY